MKDLLKYLAIVLIAAGGIAAFFGIRGCTRNANLVSEHETVFIQREDSLQHYKDAAGREHALRKQTEASLSTLRTYYSRTIDSITRTLNIKKKQLQQFITASTQTEGSVRIQIDTFYTDTTALYRFNYSDKWLYLDGVLDDDLYVNYKFTDSIIITQFWKRRWLLGRKQYYVDGYSLNPNTRFSGLSAVKVGSKSPGRIGIGPFIGYGWNGAVWTPSVGISLHYSLIRF